MKETHLGYIQNVISRMAQNSFQCKTWCFTVIVALMGFCVTQTGAYVHIEANCFLIASITAILFGMLDAYYLYLERGYRTLYNRVAELEATPESIRPYDMKVPKDGRGLGAYMKALCSITIGVLYGVITVVFIILYFIG